MRPCRTHRITAIALFCTLAYAAVCIGRIPVVLFLKYDPKDIVIALGGFLLGPSAACTVSVLVSFLEMLTISGTGPVGCVMNIISSCSFAGTAALFYRRRSTLRGAALGLAAGGAAMVCVMLLWNYIVTPLYLGYSRQAVAELLLPVFLPFNLLKAGLNSSLTLLLCRPVLLVLARAHLLPQGEPPARSALSPLIPALFLLLTCLLLFLSLQGLI